jgi:thiol:disulfide interchange protein DsbC
MPWGFGSFNGFNGFHWINMKRLNISLLACVLLIANAVAAQEAVIRKNLAERIPQLKKIDEVSKSPIAGLYEVRVNGIDIYYTDAQANYLVQGNIIDTKQKRNLTEERVDKLTAIAFDALPVKDAFTIVRGNGKRKLAVFEDPNCGYCTRFEESLQKVNNITIHMFLYPVLGPESVEKSKNIWCAKDKGKSWQDWMLSNVEPANAKCDTQAIDRNIELGKKHKISGTPTLIFTDGSRVPGAIGADQVEQRLVQAASK